LYREIDMRPILTTLVIAMAAGTAAEPARAALELQPIKDPNDFPTSLPRFTADFADIGSGNNPDTITRFAGKPGEVELSAPKVGGFFGLSGPDVSTRDGSALVEGTQSVVPIELVFSEPVLGFGIEARAVTLDNFFNVVELDFDYRLSVGEHSVDLDDLRGFTYAGVLSDTPFKEATIELLTDTGGTSGAFAELSEVSSVVPLPAAAPLFATGLAAAALIARRRRATPS